MRILMLNNEYPPLGGGQAYVNKYVYENLQDKKKYKNLQIDIITSSSNKEKIQKSKIGNIYYLDIGKKGKGDHFQTSKELVIYSIKALNKAKKLCKEQNYDMVVAISGVPAGYLAYRINKKFKIPYIVLLQGSDIPFYEERWEYLDRYIFSWLSPKIWKNAAIVNAISRNALSLARRVYPRGEIKLIYNGVDTDKFRPNKSLLKKEKNFNILFVGRLIERKGFIYLLNAFDSLAKKYPKLALHVAGGGPLENKFQEQIKEKNIKGKIIFHGPIDHDKLLKLYQTAHVSLIPSLNEALGNVTQEAMACGVPVIVTPTGSAELVKENGFIVRKKNSKDIEISIEKLIKDPILRNKMAKKSRDLSKAMDWEKVTEKYYEMFKEIEIKKDGKK